MDDDFQNEKDRTLFLSSFPEEITERLLYELFLQAGPLHSVKIVDKDKGGNRIGFITFKHDVSVPYSLELFGGIRLFGKNLQMKPRAGSKYSQPGRKSMSHPHGLPSPSNPIPFGAGGMPNPMMSPPAGHGLPRLNDLLPQSQNSDKGSQSWLDSSPAYGSPPPPYGFSSPHMMSPPYNSDVSGSKSGSGHSGRTGGRFPGQDDRPRFGRADTMGAADMKPREFPMGRVNMPKSPSMGSFRSPYDKAPPFSNERSPHIGRDGLPFMGHGSSRDRNRHGHSDQYGGYGRGSYRR